VTSDETLGSWLAKRIRSGTTNRAALAEGCGKSISTVQRHIPANLKRTGSYTTGRSILLTSSERAVIEGGLLGDATLIKNPRGAAFELDNRKKDLIDWAAVKLDRLVARGPKGRYVQSSPVSHCKGNFRFRTATWQDLDVVWARWYQHADQETVRRQPSRHYRKQVPNDFRLTSLSGLLWYLGDGSLVHKSTGETSQVIRFATHDFPLESLEAVLKPQLVRILQCKSDEVVIRPDRRVKGYPLFGYEIYVPSRYVPRWLRFIGPCPEEVAAYQYKWDYRGCVRRRWLADELESLRKYWGRIPHAAICTALGVTYEQARYAAQRTLGIHKGYSNSGKPLKPSTGATQQLRRDLRAIALRAEFPTVNAAR